jgi:hydroxybutyrate-dimer hydrolase
LATAATGSPFAFAGFTAGAAASRCNALAANGLVSGATTQERADDALIKLRTYGWEPDTDLLQVSHFQFASPAIAVTYANTYGRFRVTDNLCGFSFAALNAAGAPTAANAALIAQIFGSGNGVPPSGAAIGLVWNDSVFGAGNHLLGASTSNGGAFDFAFDGANCLRNLWTGTGPNTERVRAGVAEVLRSANLRGKPALIVHGRSDTLIPVNFSSRPYVLANAAVEGSASQLRYVEVTNGQHFDAFLGFAGYDTRFIPLHLYFNRAMDAMWAHLKDGTPLPASQLVRTTPRGGTSPAPANTAAQLPPIVPVPAAGDAIVIEGGVLKLPN